MFLQQAIPLLRPLSATLSHAHASAVALVGAERRGAQENDRGGGGSDDGVIFYPPFGAGVQEGGRGNCSLRSSPPTYSLTRQNLPSSSTISPPPPPILFGIQYDLGKGKQQLLLLALLLLPLSGGVLVGTRVRGGFFSHLFTLWRAFPFNVNRVLSPPVAKAAPVSPPPIQRSHHFGGKSGSNLLFRAQQQLSHYFL